MNHTRTLESYQESFDRFLAQKNWIVAQQVIDEMREAGFEYMAHVLRKAFLAAQFDYMDERDGDLVYIPYVHETAPELEDWWKEGEPSAYIPNEALEEHNEKYLDDKANA